MENSDEKDKDRIGIVTAILTDKLMKTIDQ